MDKFAQFITEEKGDGDIEVAVLTKVRSKKAELVSSLIEKACKKKGIPCTIVNTKEAWISKNDLETGQITVSNVNFMFCEIFKCPCEHIPCVKSVYRTIYSHPHSYQLRLGAMYTEEIFHP